MSTVHQDRHGLYVKTGGYLFRPQRPGLHRSSPLLKSLISRYKKGDKVPARHLPETGLAKVGEETWFSHGAYFNPYEQCHMDSEGRWIPPDR